MKKRKYKYSILPKPIGKLFEVVYRVHINSKHELHNCLFCVDKTDTVLGIIRDLSLMIILFPLLVVTLIFLPCYIMLGISRKFLNVNIVVDTIVVILASPFILLDNVRLFINKVYAATILSIFFTLEEIKIPFNKINTPIE